MRILLIGPQGSGKSTQGKLLSAKLKVPVISTGEIFRKFKEEDSDEGRRIKKIYDRGKLIDNETTVSLVKKRLAKDDCQNGYILDGYPRNMEQIRLFEPNFDKVIYLKISDEESISRLLKRGREDDTRELITERLNIYHEQTDPILDYYQRLGLLSIVDGSGEIGPIFENIRKATGG
ncbi:MAG: nucleoside monophosphate kinase [Candidatus Daviesbacteria bacterium]|nr:nucleoside monophosphate kinase [Candidatus Daviesbacteria bacterium]